MCTSNYNISLLRVSPARPCPVCGKFDWCLTTADGLVALCPRTPSTRWIGTGGGGYFHRLAASNVRSRRSPCRGRAIRPALKNADQLHARCLKCIRANDVGWLAGELGVSPESLGRLEVGQYDPQHFSFPMYDSVRERVVGIRKRHVDTGSKSCVSESRLGLFVPTELEVGNMLFITESETDLAALLSLGLEGVARPGCSAATESILAFAERRRPPRIVVVADNDAHGIGQQAARSLATKLARRVSQVSVFVPPVKDVREMVKMGCTKQELLDLAPKG